jgi:hypothetical protein
MDSFMKLSNDGGAGNDNGSQEAMPVIEKFRHPICFDFGGTAGERSSEDSPYPQGVGASYDEIELTSECWTGQPAIILHSNGTQKVMPFSWDSWLQISQQMYEIWKASSPARPRPTIDELEKILASEEDTPVTINPDGSITA